MLLRMSGAWARRASALLGALSVVAVAAAPSPQRAPSSAADPSPVVLKLRVDGPGVSVDPRQPGRLVQLRFDGKPGERLGLGILELELSPVSASALLISVRGPGGQHLVASPIHCFAASASRPQGSCDAEFTVAQAGAHTIEVDTPFSASSRFKAWLTRPARTSLAEGSEQLVSIVRTGQDGLLELSVEQGSEVTLHARDTTPGRSDGAFTMRVLRPDGSVLGEAAGSAQGGASIPVKAGAPAYRVEIDPAHGAQGVFTVSARGAAQLAVDGPALAFTTANPGEELRFAFEARAGQHLVLAVDQLAHAPDVDSYSRFLVLAPDGARFAYTGCMTRTVGGVRAQPCKIVLPGIPAAARYAVQVSPPMRSTVSGRLTLLQAITGQITPGTPLGLGPMKPGQVARYTFSATAGQSVSVVLSKISVTPERGLVTVTLRPLEGASPSVTRAATQGSASIPATRLPTNGTYVIVVDAGLGAVQTAEILLTAEEVKLQ